MREWTRFGLMALLALAAGCAASSGPPAEKRLTLGMLPKLDIPYFQACRDGAKQAGKELGITVDYDGPVQTSVEEQIDRVEQWIAQGYDLIAVAPNDPERIAPVLKKAKERGIVVVTFDADANPTASGRPAFVNQASVEQIGTLLVDILAEGIGKQGKAVIVSSTATAPNQNAWMAVMKPRLAKEYPQIELLPDLMPGEDQNKVREQTLQLLNATPDLKGIFALTSIALPGAAEAVRQTGRSKKVYVTGLTLPSMIGDYVRDGTVEKVVLWNPVDLGYLAVQVALRLKQGPLPDGKHDFGRLKGVAVKNGEVLLGPPLVFTKENIDQFSF